MYEERKKGDERNREGVVLLWRAELYEQYLLLQQQHKYISHYCTGRKESDNTMSEEDIKAEKYYKNAIMGISLKRKRDF
jgi:hypothetical protein